MCQADPRFPVAPAQPPVLPQTVRNSTIRNQMACKAPPPRSSVGAVGSQNPVAYPACSLGKSHTIKQARGVMQIAGFKQFTDPLRSRPRGLAGPSEPPVCRNPQIDTVEACSALPFVTVIQSGKDTCEIAFACIQSCEARGNRVVVGCSFPGQLVQPVRIIIVAHTHGRGGRGKQPVHRGRTGCRVHQITNPSVVATAPGQPDQFGTHGVGLRPDAKDLTQTGGRIMIYCLRAADIVVQRFSALVTAAQQMVVQTQRFGHLAGRAKMVGNLAGGGVISVAISDWPVGLHHHSLAPASLKLKAGKARQYLLLPHLHRLPRTRRGTAGRIGRHD